MIVTPPIASNTGTNVVILPPGTTSVVIPAANFTVRCFAPGGDNGLTTPGGGGAYSETTYTGKTPGATYSVNIPVHNTSGADVWTWFDDITTQKAHGGTNSGAGGDVTKCIGDTVFGGGNGLDQGGGGGGCAGPGGTGKNGGLGTVGAAPGGGGGGGQGGGTDGADAVAAPTSSGGDGGQNAAAQAGGLGGASGASGTDAANPGSGGGGSGLNGALCGNGADDSAGGGGGGGGGNRNTGTGVGGNGGQPGGGAGLYTPEVAIAVGGDGLIRITY